MSREYEGFLDTNYLNIFLTVSTIISMLYECDTFVVIDKSTLLHRSS